MSSNIAFRIGYGYDVHRLAPGESLILGGVRVPSDLGTVAHSDGDVLLHAISDALLGAVALGDIGDHFPDSDERWKNISSLVLLRRCIRMLDESGYRVGNIDATLVLEQPKIARYKTQMRENIAAACGTVIDAVSIKATTSETLGFVGTGQGIQAHAITLVVAKIEFP